MFSILYYFRITTTALTTPRFVNIKIYVFMYISLVSSANDFKILIDFIYSLNSTFKLSFSLFHRTLVTNKIQLLSFNIRFSLKNVKSCLILFKISMKTHFRFVSKHISNNDRRLVFTIFRKTFVKSFRK